MPVPDFQSVMLPLLKKASDGKRLAELMIDFNVGVSSRALYDVKRIDGDYFNEE